MRRAELPIPRLLPQPTEDLLPLLVLVTDVQRLLALGRADVLGLVADGKLKSVVMPDKTRRITLASVSAYFAELTGESIVAPMTGRIHAEARSPSP